MNTGPVSPVPREITADEYRARKELRVDVGGGKYIVCRRTDIQTMILEGLVPMPLLEAVQQMMKIGGSPEDHLSNLPDTRKKEFVDLLRSHACVAAIRPRIVPTDTGEPGTIPVGLLDMSELMAIWGETAIIPLMGAAQAESFRELMRANAPTVGPVGDEVPPAAEPVGVRDTPVEVRSA